MKSLFLSLTALLFLKCGFNDSASTSFRIKTTNKDLRYGDTLQAELKTKNENYQSQIVWLWDKQTIAMPFPIEKQPLGTHELSAVVQHEKGVDTLRKKITLVADQPPKLYSYKILNTYPHDQKAYTQGLEFKGDTLFESTGLKGKSTLRKILFTDGVPLETKALDDNYFGEGLTLLADKVYQLTWQAKKGFVYDQATLTLERVFDFQKSVEGWGLCNDGNYLYKSDGTNRIWKLDPQTGKELSFIEVMTHRSALNKLNELEWVNGKIYANTYQFDKQVAIIIDPQWGRVEGVIDFSGLIKKVTQHPELNVLNGIAYHSERKTFFVTGKNWDKLFEVELIEKE